MPIAADSGIAGTVCSIRTDIIVVSITVVALLILFYSSIAADGSCNTGAGCITPIRLAVFAIRIVAEFIGVFYPVTTARIGAIEATGVWRCV